ncbi:MAG: tetraacyldisaccharide 4'-kinase [Pseudobdellovibrionaceae bacterium]
MKTPSFWFGSQKSLSSLMLRPVARLYRLGAKTNYAVKAISSKRARLPVLCVGNLTAGGGGKTPTTLALLKLLSTSGKYLSPFILTRGYGGKVTGPERVPADGETVLWGDEALLLARHAPTIKSINRVRGAEYARDQGADIILMDDGAQNPSLVKDCLFMVINGAEGVGNGQLIPSGPLREPLSSGLDRADAIIMIGDDETGLTSLIKDKSRLFMADMHIKSGWRAPDKQPVVAFAGIARPERFLKTVQLAGFQVKDFRSYSDHHNFTRRDIETLLELAKAYDAKLITTEKDAVRLPAFQGKEDIITLPVEVTFRDEDRLLAHIAHVLETKGR